MKIWATKKKKIGDQKKKGKENRKGNRCGMGLSFGGGVVLSSGGHGELRGVDWG